VAQFSFKEIAQGKKICIYFVLEKVTAFASTLKQVQQPVYGKVQ